MDLSKLERKQLEDCVRYLLGGELEVRAFKARERQLEEIVKFLEEESLVDNVDDKDDKTFDRLKGFFKDLPTMVMEQSKWGETILPIDFSSIKEISDYEARASIMISDDD